MKRLVTRTSIVLTGLFAMTTGMMVSDKAMATGFNWHEQTARMASVAGAGQAAWASDASTVYYNAAGMIFLPGTNITVGAAYLAPVGDAEFTSATTSALVGPTTSGGEDVIVDAFIPTFHLTHQINDKLWVGAGITAPFYIDEDYDSNGAQQLLTDNFSLKVFQVNPSIAYKLNNHLSFSASLNIEYGIIKQSQVLPPLLGGIPTPVAFGGVSPGSIKRKVDAVGVGFSLGAIWNIDETFRLGLNYRHGDTLNFKGDRKDPLFGKVPTKFKFDLPEIVTLSAVKKVTPDLTLLFDVQWAKWSDVKNTFINDGIAGNTLIVRDWNDAWRVGVGASYQLNEDWTVRGGVSYDEGIPDKNKRFPDAIQSDIWRFAVGGGYKLSETLDMDFAYSFLKFGKGITRLSSPTYPVDLTGTAKARAHYFGAQLNWRIGSF